MQSVGGAVTVIHQNIHTERSTDVQTDSPADVGEEGAVIQHSEGL